MDPMAIMMVIQGQSSQQGHTATSHYNDYAMHVMHAVLGWHTALHVAYYGSAAIELRIVYACAAAACGVRYDSVCVLLCHCLLRSLPSMAPP